MDVVVLDQVLQAVVVIEDALIVVVPESRVARWHIFKQKIPILVSFGGSCNGRCWYIL
jgi:hypothetical protein